MMGRLWYIIILTACAISVSPLFAAAVYAGPIIKGGSP
jgi:hypothetical protein